jgi:hypothetical protein
LDGGDVSGVGFLEALVNKIIFGLHQFDIDRFYREGAMARRAGASITSNPHIPDASTYYQWDYGWIYEHACEHLRFGVDAVSSQNHDLTFVEDPAVPRLRGDVDPAWYSAALAAVEPKQPVDDFLRQYGLCLASVSAETRKPLVGILPIHGGASITQLFGNEAKARTYADRNRSKLRKLAKARVNGVKKAA